MRRTYKPQSLHDRRTYNILQPVQTHFRKATCEEVDCDAYRNGWRTRIPRGEEALLRTARASGRAYVEVTSVEDGMIELIFEPGQKCFRESQHRVSLDRPAIHVVRDGSKQAQRISPQGWHDDLGEHLDRIRTAQERG